MCATTECVGQSLDFLLRADGESSLPRLGGPCSDASAAARAARLGGSVVLRAREEGGSELCWEVSAGSM